MDIRRVQMTGGSSLVVTLPKEWTTAMRIAEERPRPGHGTARRDAPDLGHDHRRPGAADEGAGRELLHEPGVPLPDADRVLHRRVLGDHRLLEDAAPAVRPDGRARLHPDDDRPGGDGGVGDRDPDQGPPEPERAPVREHAEADVRDRQVHARGRDQRDRDSRTPSSPAR